MAFSVIVVSCGQVVRNNRTEGHDLNNYKCLDWKSEDEDQEFVKIVDTNPNLDCRLQIGDPVQGKV
jgi:hypothetical protein